MTRKAPPGSGMAGACLMWLSVTPYNPKNEQHKQMVTYCDKAFGFVAQAVSRSATGKSAVGKFCIDLAKKGANADKDTMIACVEALGGS